ncbi:MAG: DUF6915 family protein [Planctomycetia bacterium]
MAHPYHHAISSAKKFGGEPGEYLDLHEWFDASKQYLADFRHRALRHHSAGIFMLEEEFGTTITLSTGRILPVRFIGEQHVLEDLGRIPTVQDWLGRIQPESWMLGKRGRGQEEPAPYPTSPQVHLP